MTSAEKVSYSSGLKSKISDGIFPESVKLRWRYRDGVELCQLGCAFTMALTRRAIEHALIPLKCHFIPLPAGSVEVWGLFQLRRALPVSLRYHLGAHAPPASRTHSHPPKCLLIPLPRDWWRYGDYPDGVGLCQYGSAITWALTRRAVEHILIPSNVF